MKRPVAAMDIGSNTVHLLVGYVRDGRIEPVDDASELVGLAEDVYSGGAISPARLENAVEAVARLVARARERGADPILLIATAAVRDAANADELAAAIHERAGIAMQTISGEREATLTYRGAAAGEEAATLQVCDVGGGSTEVIRAEAGTVTLQTSLPMGSSRLSRSFTADPPAAGEIERVHQEAARVLAGLPAWRPERLIVTGGTATALAQVAGSTARRYVMPAAELGRLRELVAAQPSTEIAARHGVEAKRARLLPAGAAIIAAIAAAAGAAEIVLTAAGLRDGLLIEHGESVE
jgi:exopolyphosphatase/guanosine-5'-triphosphate,3'-diphosphate pyrophosphatase